MKKLKIESALPTMFFMKQSIMLPTESMFAVDTIGIIVTPVAKVIKSINSGSPDSRRDYDEQCARFSRGQSMCWDDDKHNCTKMGDMFGFYKGGECVEIHRVETVQNPSHRLPSWSDNVGQSERNVLMLSCPLCIVPWCDWVNFGWHASGPLLGTQRMANEHARVKMIQYINDVFRKGTEV